MDDQTDIRPIPISEFRDEITARVQGSDSVVGGMRWALRAAAKLGAVMTTDLTVEFLDRFSAAMREPGISHRTVISRVYSMKWACGYAVAWGRLPVSPFDARPDLIGALCRGIPKVAPKLTSPVQLKTILTYLESEAQKSVADHRLFVLAAVLVYTGVTRANAVMIRVSDVDLDLGRIVVPRRKGSKKTPLVVPIPDELSTILAEWLRVRQCREHGNLKLNAPKVAEIKRLRAEGVSRSVVAKQLNVAVQTIGNIDRGRCWRLVKPGQPNSRYVADSEWLIPSLRAGSTVQWKSLSDGSGVHGVKLLKAAGRAAGIEGLEINDLRYIHKQCIVPALVTLRPDKAASVADIPPIMLRGLRTPPIVRDCQDVPLLEDPEYSVLETLVKVHPNKLSLKTLARMSHTLRPDKVLKALRDKHEAWGRTLDIPPPKSRGGWGLKPL